MNTPAFDSDILQYARNRGIAIPSEMKIASELSIGKIIPLHYKYSDEVAIRFEKFYSTARKDLESQKLNLSHDSSLFLMQERNTTMESQVNWDNLLPSINVVDTRSSDPLQSERAIRTLQSVVSRNGPGFHSTCLESDHGQNESQSVGFDSYFAPHIPQRLGFGTVWGPPKNYDTPPRLSEILAQAQAFGSMRLDICKKACTLMSKDWRRDSGPSRKVVDSIRYEMLPQHKSATLFNDIILVPEKLEVHSGQLLQFRYPARARKIAAMRQRKPQPNTLLPNFQVPAEPAFKGLREDRQALSSIPEDTEVDTQSEKSQNPPCLPSKSPTRSPAIAAGSMLPKDVVNAGALASATASQPISVEASPELHTNASSLEESGGVPESLQSANCDILSNVSDTFVPVVSAPLLKAEIRSSKGQVENSDGKSFRSTGLTGPPHMENAPTAVLETSCISSIGPFSKGLGSLSTFMESRGVVPANGSTSSAYFPRHDTNKVNEQQHQENQRVPSALEKAIFEPSTYPNAVITLDIIKSQFATMTSDLLLFLSMDLLKTHLQIVQFLEQQRDPPRLIYREYKQSSAPSNPGSFQYQQTPPEADFIIAPDVGIILSSSHSLTQVFLPGHRPEDPYIRSNPDITSPLRERIFRLAPRYETLYLLINHPSPKLGAQTNILPAEELRMNDSTQECLQSLILFCDSLSHSTTIIPVHTSISPEQTGNWILTLTAIHAHSLPKFAIRAPDPDPIMNYVGSAQRFTLNQIIKDDETKWEVFLRAIGLNPFAARAVLDIIDAEVHPTTASENVELDSFPVNISEKESALATFIEMKPEERLRRFQGLIGELLWARLHAVIERG
ncbi:uncharacterized protein N7484_005950 [Penicillium longicatenatum]|uniref:uncharacterized protein n=1 Tax=Penicillium longicatenatum TaxID=1561947 RepID=UPI0025489824|nr:uncharacterized protein N7484_005950 [Penicillium longicatenatum]KAJ5643443.1 hypothetical protein N7484_005950 [Penicillium longicatenatum]